MQSQRKAENDRNIYANILKTLPSVESILIDPSFLHQKKKFSREFIAYSIRKQIGGIREDIKKGVFPENRTKETLRELLELTEQEIVDLENFGAI